MAFRLDPHEPLDAGLRRVAHEQLRSAVQVLAADTGDRDDDIHTARKAMKRLRGLVRLIRHDLGHRRYRRENEAYRDAAGRLAALRDATVLVATLDRLVGRLAPDQAQAFLALREELALQRTAAYDAAQHRDRVLAQVAAQLQAADERVDAWPRHGRGWKGLEDGVGRLYQRGRDEFDRAMWRPTVEHFHGWRKRVKYLWYQAQLLHPLWPAMMEAWAGELDVLGDLLGDDHDLAVLAARVRAGTEEEGADARQALLGHVGAERQRLQARVRVLGARLYGESKRDLLRRLGGWWTAWEEERILAPGPPGPAGPRRADGAGEAGAEAGTDVVAERVGDTVRAAAGSPVWHAQEGCLYWTDTASGQVWRHTPADGAVACVLEVDGVIGGCTPQVDGGLLLFLAGGAISLWRHGAGLRTVLEGIEVERESRFGDAVADAEGRVLCRTEPGPGGGGRLYRLDPDGSLTELRDQVGGFKGMGFSADGAHLYVAEASGRKILRYAYDAGAGELGERYLFVDAGHEEGAPAGVTVDAEGHPWCAFRGSGNLVRYDRRGREVGRLGLPVRQVTGVAFGGARLDDLYVTAAAPGDGGSDGVGGLFRLRPGATGCAGFHSRIGW